MILLWEDILWSFLISCSNVDSLLFRSAVQLHPWNFFSLDFWVSAIIFLCISYFLGFHPCFVVFLNCLLHGTRIRGQLLSPCMSEMCLFCFHSWLVVCLCRNLHWKLVSLRTVRAFVYYFLASGVANVIANASQFYLFVGFFFLPAHLPLPPPQIWSFLDFSVYPDVSDTACA